MLAKTQIPYESQSLVNEGRLPLKEHPLYRILGIEKSRNPSLMRAGFHSIVKSFAI